MIRIGMVGSESTHALTFARLANLPGKNGCFPFGEARVTEIWGGDGGRTRQVAREGRIPRIAEKPEDMLGRVDAVMVVPRDGSLHKRYALPFLRAGIPAWVDKPLAVRYSDALEMVKAAREHGTFLTGGSNVKFSRDVEALRTSFGRMRKSGTFRSAALNFPADLQSPYGGLYFYAGHGAEMLTSIFGGGVRSVKTDVNGGTLIGLFRYPGFTVTVNFADTPEYYGILYAADKTEARSVDLSSIYQQGFADFLKRLKERKNPVSYEPLLLPVRLLNALDASVRRGGDEVPVAPADGTSGDGEDSGHSERKAVSPARGF